MSALIGIRGQKHKDRVFDASGTISSGGTAQLLLPQADSRSSLIIQNISDTAMVIEFGSGRATASLTGTGVSSCAVTNAGFGYSMAPVITFYGGGWDQKGTLTPTYTLQGLPDWASPDNEAKAHCVMTGSAPNMTIASIVIDNPGAGYVYPPYVFMTNRALDPFGCAVPSATVGVSLAVGSAPFIMNGSVCSTDQISIFCASSGKAFTCKYTL